MPLRIGLVGANIDRGWGFRAHVPAIRALRQSKSADIALTAVATSRPESARAAADATGAEPFTSAAALAASPDVDLVVVTVKVPAHLDLVSAAQAAGKHVLCEWPLGLDVSEARAMNSRTTPSSRGFVGLQARMDPAASALRDALADGQLGTLQAIDVRSSRTKGLEVPSEAPRYTLDRRNGAGAREVHTGHVLDLADQILGGIVVTAGSAIVHRKSYRLAGSDKQVAITAPDTVSLSFTAGRALGAALIWDGDELAETVVTIQGDLGDKYRWPPCRRSFN
ncbi:putative dehydrogenase [Rhodococcus sp. 27YEA15]|uniref:Gfo/Idh/MocA family protein n=1 Tax=Rhodococcus sp. 27YEA15 TaxID=3156259 RepID=UPI003C7A4168